jgi:hypothetical protein
MRQKRRYFSDPSKKASAVITFRVDPVTRLIINSSTADNPAEFLRGVAEKIAIRLEGGATPEEVLESLDGYQTIATGGTDEPPTP